jgi:hypothetical protein
MDDLLRIFTFSDKKSLERHAKQVTVTAHELGEFILQREYWSRRKDSNLRPADYESLGLGGRPHRHDLRLQYTLPFKHPW